LFALLRRSRVTGGLPRCVGRLVALFPGGDPLALIVLGSDHLAYARVAASAITFRLFLA